MIGKILDLPNDDTRKIIFVAVSLCLVCALVVSTAAVYLKPLQEMNKALDRKKSILKVAGLTEPGVDIDQLFDASVETRLVDLDTGQFTDTLDPKSYDQRRAARDPSLSDALPAEEDIAGIGRRARYAPVYLVRDGDALDQLIIPVHGYGLWSTMYGFIALENDLQTVAGVTFYEHGETPGLGGEIENPAWQAGWVGKKIYDATRQPRLRVIKGPVAAASQDAPTGIDSVSGGTSGGWDTEFQIDGISGSTLTGKGVSNLLQFWLGENGFGPFLLTARETGV